MLRWCRSCKAWWPLDTEFWRVARLSKAGQPVLACIACSRAANRRVYERNQQDPVLAAARRERSRLYMRQWRNKHNDVQQQPAAGATVAGHALDAVA